MDTNVSATKDRPRGVRAVRHHLGGEQHRRDMHAALRELQQRLGRVLQRPQPHSGCRHSRSGTLDSRSNQKKSVPEAPQFLHRFYFLRSIVNTGK